MGAAPIDWQNQIGMTSLHYASVAGNTDIATLFIESKANINIASNAGNTPLILAARYNRMDIVRALIDAGADITIRDRQNLTAVKRAKAKGNYAIVEYLDHTIRFHSSAQDRNGRLCRIKGRSLRAIERDLKDIANFDDHMLHRLRRFCPLINAR